MKRRRFLMAGAGAAAATPFLHGAALADDASTIRLPLRSGPTERALTTAFPQKGKMILQRMRPPLLETPFEIFDQGEFTPNESFFVRWHWANIPTDIDAGSFRLKVRGNVEKELSLSLKEIVESFSSTELAAVNQCSGNSRGFAEPRVPGAQWSNGAMGNARWSGVPLKAVLARAGIKAGSVAVRFAGLDEPVIDGAPKFGKSLAVDHALDGEVMIAWAMNGAQLPLLNGFPLRLIVPGFYSTYWVKMLSDIEVLAGPDESYWTKNAYLVPDRPGGNMKPGETGVPLVSISKMVPRSFVTNLKDGASVPATRSTLVRGIAFGGSTGVKSVDLSIDGGATWKAATLGEDYGKYSFRRWQAEPVLPLGDVALMVRCTNSDGVAQPTISTWNPNGFMLNVVETVHLKAV